MPPRLALWHLAVLLGLGGAVARVAPAPPMAWVALALVLVAVQRGPARALALAAAVGGVTASVEVEGADGWAAPALVDDRAVETLRGVVVGPVARPPGTPPRYRARIETPDGVALVWTDVAVRPGDVVEVVGRLRAPPRAMNPGGVDRAAIARVRGVDAELTATSLEVVGTTPAWPWRWADGVRRAWGTRLEARPGAPLVRAAVLGDRGELDAATEARWRAAGVYHALSVSGLHLAVVALVLFALLRRVVAASPLGRRGRAAAWAAPPSLAAAVAYTLITGGEVATLRALVVVAIVLAGQALGRPTRLLDALGAAAAMILLASPSSLGDPSFQLSFAAAATFALLPGAGPPTGGRLRRAARRGGRAIAASAWVTATTAPITAAAFGEIAWGGVIGNLVVTPLLELAVIPVTLAALVIAPALPGAAGVALDVAAGLTVLADDLAGAIATITPVARLRPPGPLELVAWATGVGALLAAARGAVRPRRAVLVAAACLGVVAAARRWPDDRAGLRVTFVDVGQGDATIVETPDGQVWLIDAGGNPAAPSAAAQQAPGVEVARVLAWLGHDRVDVAVLSHPHPDHYLGLRAVAAAMPIGEVWLADDEAPPPPDLAALLDEARARGTRVHAPPLGRARAGGDATLWVLAPDGGGAVAAAEPVRSVNDNSLLVAIGYAGRRVLLLGDVELEGEELLVAAGAARAEVVKVAHHGSRTSSTPALVTASGAAIAVISAGRANRFGLPDEEVVARWRAAGATVFRTDRHGAVTVTIDARGHVTARGTVGP